MSVAPPARPAQRLGLVRARLLDALAGLRASRLAVVVAPAGTGKTTLLAHYAEQWQGPVGWWHVEPGGTTVDGVLARVWRAVAGPSAGDPPRGVDDLLAVLADDRTPDRLLVIDDLHYLGRTEAEAALEAIILRAPATLHILAGSRLMPGLNLSRHELSATAVLNAEDLRFRSWEVEYLLAGVYREPLPPDDVAALTRRVGGWAAGLHMYHLSTSGRPLAERRRAVAALDGRSAMTREYLARTVLAELPVPLREFMVRTCVFEVLTEQRCERLLGEPGTSRQHLAELARRQALTSTNDGGQTYRYHEVLRAHLAVMLAEELGDAGARELHSRAADLLVADGAHVQATRAYARAEDWAAVRQLLGKLEVRVADEEVEPLRDLLPEWLAAGDPWLSYVEARQMLSRGQLGPAIERLRWAEAHFCDEQSRARCRAARQFAAAWLPGGAPSGGHDPGPANAFGQLRTAVGGHPALVAGAARDKPFVRAAAYLLAGNVAEAGRAVRALPPDAAGFAGLAAQLLRACIEVAAGTPEGPQLLASTLADAERARLAWLVRMARAAEVLDGSARGAAEARAVVRECDRDGDGWGALLARGLGCLVRSVAEVGETADVEDATDLLDRCRQVDAGALAAWAQALLALATARAGLPDADVEAQRADALARSAGVPGARVAALAAAARCGAARVDVLAMAAECGLPAAVGAGWAGRQAQPVRVNEAQPIEVRCFGGFRMRRRGVALDWSTIKPRTRVALRLLAMHAGRPVHRETLIEALWPDMPLAAATRNLHVALSSLRTFLEPGMPRGQSGLLVRHGEAYELALPDDSYSDVATFHAALDTARRARLNDDAAATILALRTALLAYGGELLPEDGPAEWVVRERELLQRRAAEAALELATLQLARGEAGEAVAAAERCVQIDRYCDPGWRFLADACDALRNPAAAARVRREYADVLASLDIAPVAERGYPRSYERTKNSSSPMPHR